MQFQKNKNEIQNLSLISIFFFLILTLIILLQSELQYGGFNFKIPFSEITLYMNTNGAGRNLVIILIFILAVIFSKFKKNILLNVFLFLFAFLLSFYILSFEGRVNIFGYFIAIFSFCFYLITKIFLLNFYIFHYLY